MKSVNVRWEDELVRFDCPHCGVDGEVDEETLRAIWAADGAGMMTCPEPDGCQKQYILPTLEELDAHKAWGLSSHVDSGTVPAAEPENPSMASQPIPEPAVVATPILKAGPIHTRPAHPTAPIHQTGHARMKMAIRTFRHMDYKQSGQDIFDQSVSDFLEQQGTANIVSVSPISYMDRDDKLVDYGVMVVFRKPIVAVAAAADKPVWID